MASGETFGFTIQVKKDVVKCTRIKEKLEMKLNVLGKTPKAKKFFALPKTKKIKELD